MWGVNSDGRAKIPLIAWDGITKPYKEGGLQYKPFAVSADALKLRYMTRLLDGDRSKWAQMLQFFLRTGMRSQTSRREYQSWTEEEGLLLLPRIPTGSSPTTRHLIRAWEKVRIHLRLVQSNLSLPGTLTLNQIQILLHRYGGGCPFNDRIVMPVLKALRFHTLADIQSPSGRWKPPVGGGTHSQDPPHAGAGYRLWRISSLLADDGNPLWAEALTHRIPLTLEQATDLNRFQLWLSKVSLGPHTLQASPIWQWEQSDGTWRGWTRPLKFWSQLLLKPKDPDDFSARWENTPGSRAQQMRVSQGPCRWCNIARETIIHMFWEIPAVKQTWDEMRRRTWEANSPFRIRHSLLETIDEALLSKRESGALINIIAATIQTLWLDRNSMVFRNQRRRTPLILILYKAREEIEGSFSSSIRENTWNRGIKSLGEINRIFHTFHQTPLTIQLLDLSLNTLKDQGESVSYEAINIARENNHPEWLSPLLIESSQLPEDPPEMLGSASPSRRSNQEERSIDDSGAIANLSFLSIRTNGSTSPG
ncbi:hypothetical protein R1sor_014175 [Riccia sorocarpa]|uniref:Integrase n=1 Tax=Riccia sorocarpa TaxID=122646 RepID=A0ABD3HCT8_9MARC